MLFCQESKQLWRTPVRTLAICLAIALITGTMAIAHGLKLAADRMWDQVESEYTTIAYVPTTPAQYRTMKENLEKKYVSSQNPLFTAMRKGDFASEVALHIDTHSRMMAYDNDLTGAVSDIADINKPHNLALFAVRCEEITISYSYQTTSDYYIVNGKPVKDAYTSNVYYYNFTVEEVISLHEDLVAPEHLTITTNGYNLSGEESALELGGTYLIWGFYEDLGDGCGTVTHAKTLWEKEVLKGNWAEKGYLHFCHPSQYYPTSVLPILAKYDGSPEEYLAQDTTGMWAELLRIMEISYSSVQILSADHPHALRAFIDRHAELTEGTLFTEEHLESGAKVALISDILAEKNGLSVGDTLDLHFYQSTYSDDENTGQIYHNGEEMMIPQQIYGESGLDDPVYRKEKRVTQALASEQDDIYTVVGIYETDGWVNRTEYIHPNTVIIPQASLSALYAFDLPQFDRTFILPNGGADAFEAELTEAGFGGAVHYYDQGYSSVIPGVEAICHSAEFVYHIVQVLWILAVLMLLLLFTWMQMPAGRIKYRLGAGKVRIWGQMSFAALGVMLLSCIGGFAGSVLLYDRALEWMMQADFTSFNATFSTISANADMLTDLLGMMGQTPELFAKTCAVQLVILLLLAMIFAAVASLRKKSFKR